MLGKSVCVDFKLCSTGQDDAVHYTKIQLLSWMPACSICPCEPGVSKLQGVPD